MEKKNPKDELKQCAATICDWKTWYNYEFIGNTGRLVITPLTDRCYITLTQALNLSMGGAPAGPAGTGKTETTKDLGRALGLQVVVFNCSDQMNYTGMGLIFMGLSQAGAWGCFDEFNRIKIEVLSVVSTQVKVCLDAIKRLKANPANNMFIFDDDNIQIKVTCGYFITMNPGYAGRTELPENLKALFRSCAMVVPDIVLICENMLMAEGFEEAQDLSKKFMTLYQLSKSLLSQQTHYDWGLRAVKSVLRQAGGLKRADPEGNEYEILMRALRDFNLPKIVVDDRKIFKDLINDLFPNMDPPRAQNEELEIACQEIAVKTGRQPEDIFIQKCVELAEILVVRHCMFVIGTPGVAKSTIWMNMAEAFCHVGHETIYDIVDPKAVTSDELFGCMNVKTKEWRDGVLSVMMRDMNKCQGKFKVSQKYKWAVLDGDVDPMWIESLNTVMDDNKVLTLVSQERIPMTGSMRLLIEVSHLRNATPATVSRGGVLFVNETDIGWRPFIDTWLAKYKAKKDDIAVTAFTLFLTQYCSDPYLDDLNGREKIAPMCVMGCFQSLVCIIDYQYDQLYETKENQELMKRLKEDQETFTEKMKIIYEGFFAFSFMWAFGATLTEDRISFNGQMRSMSKVKFPEGGMCFDYYFDPKALEFKPWSERVEPFIADFSELFSNLVVPTAETTRQFYLIDVHRSIDKSMLYIGTAGTGKTTILKNYFTTLDADRCIHATMNFNSYTDSKALQTVLQGNVDKRSGKILGPAAGRHLIFFMDDLNMPTVDAFGTQSPLCLIRQIIDYEIIFDREHLEDQFILKDIMFAACMNPKSGSFYVDLRTTRHFTQIMLGTPEKEILLTIYQQMMIQHFSNFDQQCIKVAPKLVSATVAVFSGIALSPVFAPTASKFHYQFNMRDVAKISQNIMLAQPSSYKQNPLGLVRMWAHECHRVWLDRLLFEEDVNLYMNFMRNGLKELVDFKEEQVFEQPLIYTSFIAACKGHDPSYKPIEDMDELRDVLENKLAEYNETVSTMDLVLFNQAMEHITRIARILFQPNGHALLVGVGGSGKQSLSKLSSFILNQDVFKIVVASNYGLGDLKTDIQTLFTKTGVAGTEMLFIMTDSQIVDEKFLVYINDILSAGYIPELFLPDELDGIYGKLRGEAKS
jgi:dynein heavy chain